MADDQLTVREIEAARIFEQGKENTLRTGKPLPIVFVPGVMGSRLRLTAHNELWDPDSKKNLIGWSMRSAERAAELLSVHTGIGEVLSDSIAWDKELEKIWRAVDPNGDPGFYGRQRGWGGVSQGYYYAILKALEVAFNSGTYAAGAHPVYAFGYDWRRTVSNGATLLARRIRYVLDKHGVDKVVLVTHSMGGLVARYACAPAGCGVANLVKGVVHVVQPCNGAVVAYRRFVEGLGNERATGLEGKIFAGILGGTWWGYTMLMSGTEGPLQLMPNQVYEGWLTGPSGQVAPAADIYAEYLSGGPRSVVPELPAADLQTLLGEGLGDAPDALTRASEARLIQLDDEWDGRFPEFHEMRLRADRARAARALARWDVYRATLRGGVGCAQALHRMLAGYAHPRTFMLYAGGMATETAYRWDLPRGRRAVPVAGGGDGTVPIVSAQGLDAGVSGHWAGAAPPRLALAEDVGAHEHSTCFVPDVNQRVVRRLEALRLLP
ncbi:esterase/lipase family protein [Nannocystis bainbridge]|uniref:Lecithin:cholesterol acyltransferase n=1 Tax=Nannocystis bainbridge TaxID=2995303 RepID=A0ABT5DW93_9BACT|nr:alpha/beta fold hydrolase [Nannocystis bainbridge]MDC0717910.1 hypothetical protein [Nannocystis bainbridge]